MRWLKPLALLALLLLGAGAGAAYLGHRALVRPFRGYSEEEKSVHVQPGADAASILLQLEREGVIASARLARLYLRWAAAGVTLKAGEYRFREPLSIPRVVAKLARGEVTTHPVTLIEGLTLPEAAAALAAAGRGELEALLLEMRDPARIADLDPDATDLEGYLFPDTYRFAAGTSESAIVDELVATFRRRYRERLAARVEPAGLRRLVTLASVVEKEARLDGERPIIAGVYAHRLRRGMPLQADPTVIYALILLDRWDGNLRRPDLKVDSPYNTYRYPGLPPGPICSPGLASLEAAAAPADTPYLYFVSRNDGSHVFAATLAEHNRNVERWQRQYWRERWAEERRRRAAADSGGS
jgi:UPF0755 protein